MILLDKIAYISTLVALISLIVIKVCHFYEDTKSVKISDLERFIVTTPFVLSVIILVICLFIKIWK